MAFGRIDRMIAVLLLGVALPQAALACVIELPFCVTESTGLKARVTDGDWANPVPQNGTFVLLQDVAGSPDIWDLVLVNCPSRLSIVVTAAAQDKGGSLSASQIMSEAISSSDVVTFSQLRKTLKAAGFDNNVRPVSADHCVCAGPIIMPDNSCPDMGG